MSVKNAGHGRDDGQRSAAPAVFPTRARSQAQKQDVAGGRKSEVILSKVVTNIWRRSATVSTAGSASGSLTSRGSTITAPDQECHATTRRVHSGSISARSEPAPAWYVLSVVSPSRLSKPGRNGCWSFSVPSAGIGGQRVRPRPRRIDVTGRSCGLNPLPKSRAAYAAGAEPTWLTGSVSNHPCPIKSAFTPTSAEPIRLQQPSPEGEKF